MPVYTQVKLNADVASVVSGSFPAANFLIIANNAVRQVLSDIDLRSMKRKSALSPNLFDDVYQYTCPTDLKGLKIVDLKPQLDRGRLDYWKLTTAEEFDRLKQEESVDKWGDPIKISKRTQWRGNNLIAISTRDFVRKLLVSRPIDDDAMTVDTLDSVGDWEGFGDGENLTRDASNYIKGSASINWDINADGGTTAGIVNSSLNSFDISKYVTEGSIFVWVYISDADDITEFVLLIGSGSSNYHSITITTNNEGASFYAGWNLLRFDFADKSAGTVDEDDCDYIAIYMTKGTGKTSETDFRFDQIIMRLGDYYDLIYYSKYGWQTSGGTYIENATTTTDLLNVDTDEYHLIELKTCELMERHLKQHSLAAGFRADYEAQKEKYVIDNPSEALMLMQTYYDL